MQATPPKIPKLLVPKPFAQQSLGIVVAMGLNREIGQAGGMPWYLPEDLKHFKQQTLNSCVIMGRKTFESIGRPLPSRRNIVVTQDQSLASKFRVEVVCSLQQALEVASSDQGAIESAKLHGIDPSAAERIEYDQCFVIGGARLFAEALQLAHKVVITHIRCIFADADVFFPELPVERKFRLVEVRPEQPCEGNQDSSCDQGYAQGSFSRYFNSQAEQPALFKQIVPQPLEGAGKIELVDEKGRLILRDSAQPGLDFCYATYLAES